MYVVHKIQFHFVDQTYREQKEVIIQKSGGTLIESTQDHQSGNILFLFQWLL